jgi:branched-subunit amino acid ABC-type transport system permease component
MSLTIGVFLESILSIIFGPEGRFINLFETQSYFFFGITVTNVGILTLALGICLFIIGLFILRSTPEGRKLRATSSNKNLAIVLGIKTQTVIFITLFFATTIAGFVGVLKGMYSAVTPLAGLNLIILSFIALIVGGPNDYRGTIIASYILVLIPELLISLSIDTFSLSASWKMVFVFVIATILLTLKPQGLFYSVTRNT